MGRVSPAQGSDSPELVALRVAGAPATQLGRWSATQWRRWGTQLVLIPESPNNRRVWTATLVSWVPCSLGTGQDRDMDRGQCRTVVTSTPGTSGWEGTA